MRWQHTLLTAKVFLNHYRHSPVQASAILVGIALAVTLLIGVKATNENAISSYSEATELLSQRASAYVSANSSDEIDEQLYFALTQAGIPALAVLEGVAAGPNGNPWSITGNDLFSALTIGKDKQVTNKSTEGRIKPFSDTIPTAKLLSGYPAILMSRSLADKYSPSRKASLNGQTLEVIAVDDSAGLGNELLADLSLVQPLLKREGKLSYIALYPKYEGQTKAQLVDEASAIFAANDFDISKLNISADDDGTSLSALTDSFHLNLKAMGMLAFLVGLFIAYNGVRYSLMKRHSLCIQLMQQGVARPVLMMALVIELLILVIMGTLLGFIIGLQLSQWLQPMVALTLEQLYGARLMPGQWQWQWFTQALMLTSSAALFACLPMLLGLSRSPLAQGAYQRPKSKHYRKLHRKLFMFGSALLLVSFVAINFTTNYQHSLVLLGGVTVAIPLMLPQVLTLLISLFERFNLQGLTQYTIAESKQIIAPLGLAMMAMLLAICANIAMNTLVGSFEITLKQWLESRLHAELYIKPNPQVIPELKAKLAQDEKVSTLYAQWRANAKISATFNAASSNKITAENGTATHLLVPGASDLDLSVPIALVSRDLNSVEQTSAMKQRLTQPGDETLDDRQYWQAFADGEFVIISEPLAIKQQLNIGDSMQIDKLTKPVIVGGIYYDYGNPAGEVIISQTLWQASPLPRDPISFAVDYQGELDELQTELKQTLNLSNASMYSQTRIKKEAIAIFKRTFSITLVLNSLTLIVAAIGLFSATTMLTQARLAPFARLFALGVSRRQLQKMAFSQMLFIVLLTCLVAMPMGALLGYLVISKVTLQAFGWSIAMVWDWGSYGQVVATSIVSCLLAVAAPLYWQTRKPLIASLQQEGA
ncbi:FtsX-like permease family protein [Shewanella maritima]|uniref:FtsX-like permease family protein n=1 Tax=Shewanella maritima TaxID=2520507 RepID=A0A411PGQ6_9GAMM|nr:ABC transporter permease [Shewanella maritima]QBF82572.1 FtsX-like permease family protein [Shewanella maritima]